MKAKMGWGGFYLRDTVYAARVNADTLFWYECNHETINAIVGTTRGSAL